MKKRITYKWGSSSLLIELGNRTEQRIQVLFWGEFLFTTGMATILLLRSLPLNGGWMNGTIGILSAALYIVAAYRFLVRMFSKENILLTDDSIALINETPFRTHTRHFPWQGIGPLLYIGAPEKTDHPLKGKSFDYFGFDTHEHLIQRLHHNGNLCFRYEGYPVHFARGVFSWNAEEMISMMQLFAGDKFQLSNELQQLLNPVPSR